MKNCEVLSPLLIKQAELTLARRNLIDFTCYNKHDFQRGWFNELLAAKLQKFFWDAMAGKRPRLIIQAPPRSGKSELVSRQFPAWAFGQNPNLKMIAASYSSSLADLMNADVKRIIDDDIYRELFPNTKIAMKGTPNPEGKKCVDDFFEILQYQGAYRSAGVGVGITGMGADIGIIDDPVKDAEQAGSATYRQKIKEWFTSTFYTRLSPNNGVLICMTRWHSEDLVGWLLEQQKKGEGDNWEVVNFPAIAEEDEEYRKEGEALHPDRYSLDDLAKIRKMVGPHVWNALYQQRPTSKGGGVIKGEWFYRYKVPPVIKFKAIYADTASKTKNWNDYSVFMVCGVGADNRMYILDLIRGKWDALDLKRTLIDVWNKHQAIRETGALTKVVVEDASSGTALIQYVQRETHIPIFPLRPEKDKYSRVLGIQGYLESGRIAIPENAPWVSDFIKECEEFTENDAHKHDDQIDPMVMAINDLLGKPVNIWDCL